MDAIAKQMEELRKKNADNPFWTPWPLEKIKRPKPANSPSEYKGTKTLIIDKAGALQDWSHLFAKNTIIERLILNLKCSQAFFEAACQLKKITSLSFKWGPIDDLSPIRELKNLERLFLGSNSVTDLTPIRELINLKHLALENLDRLSDYSPISELKNMEYLQIDGAVWAPKKVWIEDLNFLRELPKLKGLSMSAVKIRDADFVKSFDQLNLEYLDFSPKKKDAAAIIEKLPNLRKGRIYDAAR